MLKEKLESLTAWTAPAVPDVIPQGDMPGDKVQIGLSHIAKASAIFPLLLNEMKQLDREKIVVSVFGGSGVGKSETASLLAWYLNCAGIGAYVMSGDNYPRRIPLYNDAERNRVFRTAGPSIRSSQPSSGRHSDSSPISIAPPPRRAAFSRRR